MTNYEDRTTILCRKTHIERILLHVKYIMEAPGTLYVQYFQQLKTN